MADSYTAHRNYIKSAEGKTPWTNDHYSNMDAIDLDMYNALTSADALSYVLADTNKIINPEFALYQRDPTGATNPINGAYIHDRWVSTKQSGTITATRLNHVSGDAPPDESSHALSISDSVSEKFGVIQIIEYANCVNLRGKKVSLSFKAKCDAGVGRVRAGILRYDGATADTIPTKILITGWGVANANPSTFAAGWGLNFVETPTDLSVTNSWQTFTINDITLGTPDFKNLAIVIWANSNTNASGSDYWTAAKKLYLSQVFLHVGEIALPYGARNIEKEIALCQRYYEKSYNLEVKPATITDNGMEHIAPADGSTPGFPAYGRINLRPKNNTSYSVYFYRADDGSSGDWKLVRTGSVDAMHSANKGTTGFQAYSTSNSTQGAYGHWVVDAEI